MSNIVKSQANQLQVNSIDGMMRLADILHQSGYFSDVSNPAQAFVKIMAGREMGFGDIKSLMGIHIIKGKTTVGANLLAYAVKSHPKYDYRVRKNLPTEVSIEFFQDGQSIGTSSFTAEDAQKAGTQNMNKFPRNMLFARAMSNGVRWFCPDATSGQTVYTPEELGGEVDEDGELIIDVEPPDPQQSKLEHFNNWLWPAVQKRTNNHFQTPDQLMSVLALTPQTLPDPSNTDAWVELGKTARQHYEAETIPDADGKLADFQALLDEAGIDNGNRQMWLDQFKADPNQAVARLKSLDQPPLVEEAQKVEYYG